MYSYDIKVKALFTSPKHNYFGHKNNIPSGHETVSHTEIRCVTDKGIEGDRFFDIRPGYDGQVTFFNEEVYQLIQKEQQLLDKESVARELFRRNIVLEGVSVVELIGKRFEIGGVVFEGVKHCAPCRWMDIMMGKGVMKLMKGRGGLRARVVKGGTLYRGAQQLLCDEALFFNPTEPLHYPKIP